jgi:neutral ceramidase
MESNINRSPSSYRLNPQSERDKYADQGDTDKTMLLLKFMSDKKKPLGALNWFAVHGTSLNSTNLLISGDNKGYASYLMEKHFNGNDTLPGKGDFVAAFASTNLGDVSPNTGGPRCIDTGLPCDFNTSTCDGKTEKCIAFGPGQDMFESAEIIGRNQYEHGTKMFNDAKSERLRGDVTFRHSFVDMSNRNVTLAHGDVVTTCPAALGYSFAAGTTDGPGDFDFTQGTNSSNPFWNMIGGFLSVPTKEQIACQHPKPILLNTGSAKLPYQWDPSAVPVSIFRVGQLFILNVPGEFTTMAGRRLREAVRNLLVANGINEPIITIAGLANSYTHYITTIEEYAGQRYEAASTLYGPHTLSAYIQEFERITTHLLDGTQAASDKPPDDLSKKQLSLVPPVIVDNIGIGRKFGSVTSDAFDQYLAGQDTVKVTFRSANPRNNQRLEGTFLTVDHLEDDGSWETVFVDGDWSTKYVHRGNQFTGVSFADILWNIPSETPQGLYRVCHYGTRKRLVGFTETLAFHLPDWVVTNLVGSIGGGLLLQLAREACTLSQTAREYISESLSRSRYLDFEGCSKTFLVKKNKN